MNTFPTNRDGKSTADHNDDACCLGDESGGTFCQIQLVTGLFGTILLAWQAWCPESLGPLECPWIPFALSLVGLLANLHTIPNDTFKPE